MNIPSDIPKEALPILNEMGYFDTDRLHVGDASPLLTLPQLGTDTKVTIGSTESLQPTVLVFGSYT